MCNCQVVIRIFVTFDNLIFRPEKMTQISEKEAGTEVIQLNQYTDEVMGGFTHCQTTRLHLGGKLNTFAFFLEHPSPVLCVSICLQGCFISVSNSISFLIMMMNGLQKFFFALSLEQGERVRVRLCDPFIYEEEKDRVCHQCDQIGQI